MSIYIEQRYCPNCQKLVLGQQQNPDHMMHFLFTIVTVGLWLIIWFACCLDTSSAFLCSICGTATESKNKK